MRRLGPGASPVVAIVVALLLVGAGLTTPAVSQAAPDRSDVVLVLDFSASILEDRTTRGRFGGALERIAARVDETASDLVAGDTTVTIVQFATHAADYPGCTDLKLLGSAETVTRFANCLRAVAAAYRKGLASALTKRIGIDTNYVAAMELAARHLPVDAVRPTMILFTDGKHDVKGVPVSRVQPALASLFGSRSPFALLPVGMGLAPKSRTALAAGLERLRVIRNMPACISGATFDWPEVVFKTADAAGSAVAVALEDATCTFTAAPVPTPKPVPPPDAIKGIRLSPGDGRIEVAWTPAAVGGAPVVDYTVQCRAGEGDWIASTEGVSLDTSATVEGLTNGTAYQCEVAGVGPSGPGPWNVAAGTVTPFGRPPPPAKPAVQALNHALQISVVPEGAQDISSYHYECTQDNGTTWPARIDVAPDSPTTLIGNLTNGVDYLCRAFATNVRGSSDASPLSDSVRPCGSFLECNALLVPALGALGVLLAIGLLAAFVALARGRSHGYVVAVLDVVHTANVGHGSNLGIALVRAPGTRVVTGIVADKGPHADARIRKRRGGKFEVRDKVGKHVVSDGEALVIVDSVGVKHGLVLQAFETTAASRVARRR